MTDRRAITDLASLYKMSQMGQPTRPPMMIGMPPSSGLPTTGRRPIMGQPTGPPMVGMPARGIITDMEAKPVRSKEFTPLDMMKQQLMQSEYAVKRPFKPTNEHNNQAVRPFVGHPKFGFQTMLNDRSFGQLPTAPAIVGGNTDWTSSKVTPATQYLHSVLAGGRPMNPAPALGSTLRLTEPTLNSIHTTY